MEPKISISIATYEANGNGLNFIKKNVESFKKQTYKNIELVISDHSINDDIKEYIDSLNDSNIKYVKNVNDRGLQVENINNAISNCSGDFIKLMNHDDYMESEDSIECGVKLLNKGYNWVVYSCKHLNYNTNQMYFFHTPKIENNGEHFLHGLNYIGCPSVGLIPKGILLDTNVKYMGDCELWYRLFTTLGYPGLVDGFKVVIGMGDHTLTHKFADKQQEMLNNDIAYCKLKYKSKI
jgi:glycosyltransferase involved in cell wall biosynthesis